MNFKPRFTEDVLARLRGRIALVGNASIKREYGHLIDSYDTVIRFNNFRIEGHERFVGTRTDFRCTSAWDDVEHRNEQMEFSPFTAESGESLNLTNFNQKNAQPVLAARLDVHPFLPEIPKPSTGLSLVQLFEKLGLEADLFGFDGFRSPHYWEKEETFHTTHSKRELEVLVGCPHIILMADTYPYEELYEFCHRNHRDYDENVGLELVRRMQKSFRGQTILEFGAGNGELSAHLESADNRVTAFEVSPHAFEKIQCSKKVRDSALGLPFVQERFDWFVSVDVLEHLTESDIRLVLRESARLCNNIYLSVSTRPSGLLGPKGENLHLTVRPADWWIQLVSRWFDVRLSAGYGVGQIVLEGPLRQRPALLSNSGSLPEVGDPETHFIKSGYTSRKKPEYFEDLVPEESGVIWQPEVYATAAWLGRQLGCSQIIDVGCGRATKLAAFHPEFSVVGLDFGSNLDYCRERYPFGRWLEADLEKESWPITAEEANGAIIICADVIEHLVNPRPLLRKLRRLLERAHAVVISTPERELTRGMAHMGPPDNPAHTREWTLEELLQLMRAEGFKVDYAGLTPSNNLEPARCTILIIAGNARGKHYEAFEELHSQGINATAIAAHLSEPIEPDYYFRDLLAERNGDRKQMGRIKKKAPPRARKPGWSFCIITNGKRPAKLEAEIASIRSLGIPHYEILVSGEPPAGLDPDIRTVPALEAARNGRLGEMRNRATEAAQFDHLVVCDDDMLFHPDFYEGMIRFGQEWEVLCVRLLNPDGSRFWDWATYGGPRGHSLLDYQETDPFTYITGGLCIMKASVADRVQWDEQRGFYQAEDVDFSTRLHEAGIPVKHNPYCVVTHSDLSYSQHESTVIRKPFAVGKPVRCFAQETPNDLGDELWDLLLPLQRRLDLGFCPAAPTLLDGFAAAGGKPEDLQTMLKKGEKQTAGIVISHGPAPEFKRVTDGDYHVGRTAFAGDRVPANWVAWLNRMDEVWVPSEFHLEACAKSGVEQDKLVVIPSPLDGHVFDPARHQPMQLPNKASYNFLALISGSTRTDWEVLVAAYLQEFSAADDVCLFLGLPACVAGEENPEAEAALPGQKIERLVQSLELGKKPLPRLELFALIPPKTPPGLFLATDCYIEAGGGGHWGRNLHKAMLLERAVIATPWGGPSEYLSADYAYLLDYELVKAEPDEPESWLDGQPHRAVPLEAHLRQLLRKVQQNPDEARKKGRLARQFMARHYGPETVAEQLIHQLAAIERKVTTPGLPPTAIPIAEYPLPNRDQENPLVIRWEESNQSREQDGALRELREQLEQSPCLHVLSGATQAPASAATDAEMAVEPNQSAGPVITVRPFSQFAESEQSHGPSVLLLPWEFGAVPEAWLQQAQAADQIWTHSEHGRRTWVDSGADPAKVKVLPLGVDAKQFHPDVPPMALPTQKAFKFLYTGGAKHQYGPDLLLHAYLDGFTPADNVCLVIHLPKSDRSHRAQLLRDCICAAQSTPEAPEVVCLEQEFSADELAGLYTACDCLVHPYRAEVLGMPALQAMACALPVIVTGGGATDGFAADAFTWRIPAKREVLEAHVEGTPLVQAGWWLDPSVPHLQQLMQTVFSDPATARAKAARGQQMVSRHWTWDRTGRQAADLLQPLSLLPETRLADPEAGTNAVPQHVAAAFSVV